MAKNYNQNALQAMALMRLHLDSGVGMETALYRLSKAGIGTPSDLADSAIKKLKSGESLESTMTWVLKKATKSSRAEEVLWSSLMISTGNQDQRLASASDEILARSEIDSEKYAGAISRGMALLSIVMMIGIVPAVISFLAKLPANPFLDPIDPDPRLVYAVLMLVSFVCLFVIRPPKKK